MFERFGFGIVAADDYFTDSEGNYQYDPKKTVLAHAWCQERCLALLQNPHLSGVVVHNTSTRESDVRVYQEYAERHGHMFISLVLENRHGNTDVHNVPEEVLVRQEEQLRNSMQLRFKYEPTELGYGARWPLFSHEEVEQIRSGVDIGASVKARDCIAFGSEQIAKELTEVQPMPSDCLPKFDLEAFKHTGAQGKSDISHEMLKNLVDHCGVKKGEINVITAGVNVGTSTATELPRKLREDELAYYNQLFEVDTTKTPFSPKSVTYYILSTFNEPWMSPRDKKDMVEMFLEEAGLTYQAVYNTVMEGLDCGAALHQVVSAMRETFKAVK
ncbi:DNA ligase [Vibrio phage vB_VchM_Kuja]|uniref:DNA ligase n=1 Tax=Vibrio phage vB_VchM_Kuja TaxID=2686437 RepID=A0A6B9JBZ4_9CAUD|nr:ATPase [Vibrio phage vB_VchM_Kuja]QGZ16112.1 DNA ligase [Vibrio phage vB_VchM_Kuja]